MNTTNTTATKIDSTAKPIAKPYNLIEDILGKHPQQFSSILQNAKKHNLQIIYTQIDRDNKQQPILKNHYFNVNKDNYFYPASCIKLPIAILALQKLNELKSKGIDKNTTMLIDAGFSGQSAVYNDPTTANGKPSIAHYIKKICMVSDNDAFNRLYEFLGQDYINSEFAKRGYTHTQVLHRLQISLTEAENRATNPISFVDATGKLLYSQPLQQNTSIYTKRNEQLGTGYYTNGVLINEPMDFSKKNRMALEEFNIILTSIVFPNSVMPKQRFNITEEDRQFLLKNMSQLATESTYPPYSQQPSLYNENSSKLLMTGNDKTGLSKSIRIFNKTGGAYGHLLDVAYIVDFEKKIEFMVSAVIYCNEDGILNDDKYDYETIGYPFFKNLGNALYEYELSRKRNVIPDLSEFKFVYDK